MLSMRSIFSALLFVALFVVVVAVVRAANNNVTCKVQIVDEQTDDE